MKNASSTKEISGTTSQLEKFKRKKTSEGTTCFTLLWLRNNNRGYNKRAYSISKRSNSITKEKMKNDRLIDRLKEKNTFNWFCLGGRNIVRRFAITEIVV